MLTVEAYRLSHTDDVFHLVVPVAETKPLFFYSCKRKRLKVNKCGHVSSWLFVLKKELWITYWFMLCNLLKACDVMNHLSDSLIDKPINLQCCFLLQQLCVLNQRVWTNTGIALGTLLFVSFFIYFMSFKSTFAPVSRFMTHERGLKTCLNNHVRLAKYQGSCNRFEDDTSRTEHFFTDITAVHSVLF